MLNGKLIITNDWIIITLAAITFWFSWLILKIAVLKEKLSKEHQWELIGKLDEINNNLTSIQIEVGYILNKISNNYNDE